MMQWTDKDNSERQTDIAVALGGARHVGGTKRAMVFGCRRMRLASEHASGGSQVERPLRDHFSVCVHSYARSEQADQTPRDAV